MKPDEIKIPHNSPDRRGSSLLRGFSLIELLLVIIILGVLIGLVLPNLSKVYSRFQVSETAKSLVSLLRFAQAHAVMNKKTCEVEFNPTERFYLLKEEDPESWDVSFKEIRSDYGRKFSWPPEVTLELEIPAIRFYPNGKMDKARIVLSDQKGHFATVSTREQAGYVQLFDFKVQE